MRARLLCLPLIVQLMGFGAVAMFVPAIHAYGLRNLHVARSFFYSGLLFLTIFALIAAALGSHRSKHQARSHLIALLLAFTLLPIMLAVPFSEGVGNVRFLNAW
ncbi:hypothetical protein LCGC14_2922650, partial [marine sediment metagenome]